MVSEGGGSGRVVGEAAVQARAGAVEQGRQRRNDQGAGKSDRGRPGVAGSRAGESRHRAAEEVTPHQGQVPFVSRPLRFTCIVFLAALGTALAAVGGWRYARASAPLNGPIILISIDTLRADHLPVYGYTDVRTPAIDAVACDGVAFERSYSHSSQTLQAHFALLLGRLQFETGVLANSRCT